MKKGKKQKRKGENLRWLKNYWINYGNGWFFCLLIGMIGTIAGLIGCVLLHLFLKALGSGGTSRFFSTALLSFSLFLLSFGCHFAHHQLIQRIQVGLQNDLWFDLYDHLLDVNWEKAQMEKDVESIQRQEQDVRQLTEGIVKLPAHLILQVIQLGGILLLLASCDRMLAAAILLGGLVCLFFLQQLQQKSTFAPARLTAAEDQLTAFYRDSLQYMRWIQTFSMQDYFMVRLTEQQRKWRRAASEKNHEGLLRKYGWKLGRFFLVVIGLGRSVPLLWCGRFGTGTWFWIFLLLLAAGDIFSSLGEALAKMASLSESIARYRGWMEMPIEVRLDEEWTELLRVRERDGLSVYVEQVEYAENAGKMPLRQMSFEAHPGEWIGIDCQPQAGRNALVQLLLGQVFPQAGEIRLSHERGIQCQVSAATRPFFAYVSREVVMFPGTLADNLRLGRNALTEEQLWAALDAVCARHFVEMLPQELNTFLGEQGAVLSAPELQQLALARAILTDAPIILLEDVTSALPPALERDILMRLYQLWRRKTCIFLAPRLQVLGRCDRVYLFEESELLPAGELVDEGGVVWEAAPCDFRQLAEVFAPGQ